MITRIATLAIAVFFAASVAFGQMTYGRKRSAGPSPTPTPTPTPRQGVTQVQKQRTMPQRPTPAPMPPRHSPTPSGKLLPAQNQPLIPARKAMAAPTPTFQRAMATPTPSPQRTRGMQMQPRQSPTPAPRIMQPAPQAKPTPPPGQFQTRQIPTTGRVQPMASPKPAAIPPRMAATPAPIPVKPTPTPVPPPDVKVYLDRQLAKAQDKKFHMTVNGKDLPLTPFHVWPQKSTGPNTTSTMISMRSDEGRVYDIDFMTTGAQVSGIRIHRINGEAVR